MTNLTHVFLIETQIKKEYIDYLKILTDRFDFSKQLSEYSSPINEDSLPEPNNDSEQENEK